MGRLRRFKSTLIFVVLGGVLAVAVFVVIEVVVVVVVVVIICVCIRVTIRVFFPLQQQGGLFLEEGRNLQNNNRLLYRKKKVKKYACSVCE